MIEFKRVYKNYQYVIVFNEHEGWRCGYVGIPKGDVYYEKHYDDIPVECHGGLSFSEFSSTLGSDLWWIGFACNVFGEDGIDFAGMEAIVGTAETREYRTQFSGIYLEHILRDHVWSTYDVDEECKKIIDQIQRLDIEALMQ